MIIRDFILQATLTIRPGVIMEFAPNVGLLVLGVLKAQGRRGDEIIMKPLRSHENLESNKIRKRSLPPFIGSEAIRLCTGRNCTIQTESNEYGKYSELNLSMLHSLHVDNREL